MKTAAIDFDDAHGQPASVEGLSATRQTRAARLMMLGRSAEIERNLDLVVERQQEWGRHRNDGETPRVGFSTYTTERMTGFGGDRAASDPGCDQVSRFC
jgi:hypothetical protein